MPNITSITTGLFPVNSETYSSTLSSSIGAGVTTVPVVSGSPYSDGDYVVLTVDAGTVKQATFHGTKSGSSFINCVWTEGAVGVGHDAGAPIQDYDSATHFALVTKGLRVEHDPDGTHGAITTTSVTNAGNYNQTGGTFTVPGGTVTPLALEAGAGATWVWQNWTVTWTNLSVGNGTLTAKFAETGKTVFFRMGLVFGSTTTIGAVPTFTLPKTSANYTGSVLLQVLGAARVFDQSAGTVFNGCVPWRSTTTAGIQIFTATGGAGTGLGQTDLSSTVPWTWTTGDEFYIQGFYEKA